MWWDVRRGVELDPLGPGRDIYETEQELVVKADLPDVNPQDLDIHVENNILTIRGERKFENKANEENYLRVERVWLVQSELLAGELRELRSH
jgi:Molecular chaperone (small heat shock protein)